MRHVVRQQSRASDQLANVEHLGVFKVVSQLMPKSCRISGKIVRVLTPLRRKPHNTCFLPFECCVTTSARGSKPFPPMSDCGPWIYPLIIRVLLPPHFPCSSSSMASWCPLQRTRLSECPFFQNEPRIAPQISTGIDVSRALMGTDKLLEIGERECSR